MTSSRKAIGIFSIVAFCALVALSATASAAVINVPSAGNATIQQAINNASAGDTILVNAPAYNAQGIPETVDVTQSNIIIRSVNGRAVVSAEGVANKHVFDITDQTNVTLDGFTIRDAQGTSGYVAGIYMSNASECIISNNTVTNISATGGWNAFGIWLEQSSNNNTFSASTSVSNITANNTANGIYLYGSNNNRFNSSTSVSNITGGDIACGIYLSSSSDNNTFSSSTSVSKLTTANSGYAWGIYLSSSSNNSFSSSTSVSNITENWEAYGIALTSSSNNNTFSSSTSVYNVTGGDAHGIYLYESSNNSFSSSTSVSTITASNINGDAFGIVLFNSNNNNTFSSSTSVSYVNATNGNAYGIFLYESSNNSFSASTSVSNVTATTSKAYGISLGEFSNDNNFTGITITPTITGSESYEFYSEETCDNNVVTDMTIGNPTTISFTYGNGIRLKRVEAAERPGDPGNYRNISKYINASNVTANSWLFVNFSYSQNDVLNWVDEGTLKVWKHNGTAWSENGWNGSRVLDTTNKVVGVNITSFSIFAPLGIPATSVTIPTATGTGNVTITTSSGYFCDIPEALKASDFPGLPDSALTFKHGFFNFSICGLNTSTAENVTINFTFPSAIPTDSEFWKYNASNGTWYRYDFGDNDGDNVISITITDNGPGDHNPVLGIIGDPNGVGSDAAAAEVPALTPIGLVVLVSVLSGIAATTITRNKGKRL